ncbi:MAG TPA: PspC domain-containing protein [bacterium]|nr:PspC domain-containing protein [bacterium]HPR87748.1 PspC domain-containing protein [bacterium]
MKTVVDITLGGAAFHVDEEVCQHLQHYLLRLERLFAGEAGGAEIMADIESRMAELFRERLTRYRQVLLRHDLEAVMAILGSPEAISGGAVAGEEATHVLSRRFYRDPDRRLFGGVCAGLAARFSWSPLIFRIAFTAAAMAGGFGLALYLVLWLLLPEARTTAQKLEMHSTPVTIGTITAFVKNGVESVRKKINL